MKTVYKSYVGIREVAVLVTISVIGDGVNRAVDVKNSYDRQVSSIRRTKILVEIC